MKDYKSVETQFIPPGAVTSIEAFKELVLNELQEMMKAKKKYEETIPFEDREQLEGPLEIPLPLTMYALYKDFSINKTMMFPHNDKEKAAMVLAIKKQTLHPPRIGTAAPSREPLYGAIVTECWITRVKLPEDMNEEEKKAIVEAYHSEDEDKRREAHKQGVREEKETRVMVQFEDALGPQYDIRVFKIIDPHILVDVDEESEKMSAQFTHVKEKKLFGGILMSLFDWTPEMEKGVTGGQEMNVHTYSLYEAVDYIQKLLKENPDSPDFPVS